MSDDASAQEAPKDPRRDAAFERFVAAWTNGWLGLDKHEGVGLLWKEGLISDFLATVFRRAPETLRALGERLAEGAPAMAADTSYVPRRLILEFVEAMRLPLGERRARFNAFDLPEPGQELSAALAELEPPMERRFRMAIEAWIDAAAAIEARCNAPVVIAEPTFVVGAKVSHAQWGPGVIVALSPGPTPIATVAFAEQGQKKVLVSFLTLST
jgi:hypothetical protein